MSSKASASAKLVCEDNLIPYNHLFSILTKCQQRNNENYARVLRRALNGIRRHPTAIRSLADAMAVDGVGDKLGGEILRSLDKAAEDGVSIPIQPSVKTSKPAKASRGIIYDDGECIPASKKIRGHLLEAGKGPWLIILCMIKLQAPTTKLHIMRKSIELNLDVNIKEILSSSIVSLKKKMLIDVQEKGNIILTEEGMFVAEIVEQRYDANPTLYQITAIINHHDNDHDDKQSSSLSQASTSSVINILSSSLLPQPDHSIAVYEYDLSYDTCNDAVSIPATAMLSLRERLALASGKSSSSTSSVINISSSSSRRAVISSSMPVSLGVDDADDDDDDWIVDLTSQEQAFISDDHVMNISSSSYIFGVSDDRVVIDLLEDEEDDASIPSLSQQSTSSSYLPMTSSSLSVRHPIQTSSCHSHIMLSSAAAMMMTAAASQQSDMTMMSSYPMPPISEAMIPSSDPAAIAAGLALLKRAKLACMRSSVITSIAASSSSSSSSCLVDTKVTVMNPGDYEVMVLVDQREKDRHLIQTKLLDASIPCRIVNLTMGDFLYIAIPRPPPSSTSPIGNIIDAVILDAICERKTFHDLSSSIIDGRYEEQKSRLKECGVRSKVYLVEGMSHSHANLSSAKSAALRTAMLSVQIESDLQVVRTRSIDHSIDFFKSLYRQVHRRFVQQPIGSKYDSYDGFQRSFAKKQITTMGQLYGHQLRQVPGCSAAVVAALVNKYTTLANMIRTLQTLGQFRAKEEIENLRRPDGMNNRLGPKVADTIWKLLIERF